MADQNQEQQVPMDQDTLVKALGEKELNLIVAASIIKKLEEEKGKLIEENHNLRNEQGDKKK